MCIRDSLKSTSKLHAAEIETDSEILNADNIESELLSQFEEKNPSNFNFLIPSLMRSLQTEKLEDETQSSFEDRLLSESRKVIENALQKD